MKPCPRHTSVPTRCIFNTHQYYHLYGIPFSFRFLAKNWRARPKKQDQIEIVLTSWLYMWDGTCAWSFWPNWLARSSHSWVKKVVCFLLCRYTTDAKGQLVFATLLKWPDNYAIRLGAVKPASDANVTLLGYGKVQWTHDQSTMTLTMPYLPLDSALQWAWTFQMEGVSPAARHRGKTRSKHLRNQL